MSTQPEEAPKFNFSLDVDSYSPEVVAEQVIWPLVDDLSRRDWRQESIPGAQMTMPGRVIHDGAEIDVILIASAELDDDIDEDETVKISFVELHIEEIRTGENRQLILGNALDEECAKYESVEDYMLADHLGMLRDFDHDDLVVKSSVIYSFNTEGNFTIDAYQRIETSHGNYLWTDSQETDEDDQKPEAVRRFLPRDIELITIALQGLYAPASLRMAMRTLPKQ